LVGRIRNEEPGVALEKDSLCRIDVANSGLWRALLEIRITESCFPSPVSLVSMPMMWRNLTTAVLERQNHATR
jgi:hypothetical protein